ncbi:MAG: formylglycine-generating enzyme family protein, partial [Planctomycetes bacterium]|nr:formylglycine-generating enzyme family protein [Planctomycetota bacterium]
MSSGSCPLFNRPGRFAPALLLLASWAFTWAPVPARAALPEIVTASGATMLLVPSGEFFMGSESGQADEKPVHKVKLSAFYMDKHLVTQKDYESLIGSNPSHWPGKPENPVDQVRWSDAARYCNVRSLAEGFDPCYDLETWKCDFTKNGYHLPTEAQWEYACRAGTRTAYFFGDKPRMLQVYAWYARNSGKRTRPVGRKKPNPWGFYDMGGNLWQWCNDFYQVDYYKVASRLDPQGPETGQDKVVRGGCWNSTAEQCRSAARFKEDPAFTGVCFQHEVY